MTSKNDIFRFFLDSTSIKNDDQLLDSRDKKSLKQHSENYDTILSNYTAYVEKTLDFKRKMKKAFFVLSFIVMIICILLVIIFIIYSLICSQQDDFNISSFIAPFITAISSFLTVFLVIPKIIAKYLFNNDEESVMQNMIISIQEYDKYIRNNIKGDTKNRIDNSVDEKEKKKK